MQTIITDKIVSGGDCIGKIDGKTVFVSGTLPNETAEIEIIQSKKDYDKARAVSILEPSPHRKEAPCPLYGSCGGCNLQHATPDYQRELKKSILQDSLERAFYKTEVTVPEIKMIFDADVEYRSRFQFHKGGLKKRGSNEVVKIEDCLIATPEIRATIKAAEDFGGSTDERFIIFGDKRVEGEKKVFTDLPKNDTVCTISINEQPITFDVRGFFQSNITMLEKTIPLLEKDLSGTSLLDMYAGVGTLSAFVGKTFKEITLVEHNKKALAFSKKNLAHLQKEGKIIKTFAFSGEKWLHRGDKKDFDAVIIDPPRSGIEKKVCAWLCESHIKNIRYLSCDPVTFARDAKKLCENGYTLDKVFLLDYYPQTSHIETLGWFSK